MEIRLSQEKLIAFGVNVDEIITALKNNHFSLPVGKFQEITPAVMKVEINTEEDFEDIDKIFELIEAFSQQNLFLVF